MNISAEKAYGKDNIQDEDAIEIGHHAQTRLFMQSSEDATNNGDILHRLILGKTKSGEVFKDWSNQDWNGFCRQCGTVLETFQHIFENEVVENYYNDLSTYLGVYRIYDLKTLFGDHSLWHDGKLRSKILAQFAISSFIIAEISAGRLTDDKLSLR